MAREWRLSGRRTTDLAPFGAFDEIPAKPPINGTKEREVRDFELPTNSLGVV